MRGFPNHPYIPNSDPQIQAEMLKELGMSSLDELHRDIPEEIRLHREMDIPEAFDSEYALRRQHPVQFFQELLQKIILHTYPTALFVIL